MVLQLVKSLVYTLTADMFVSVTQSFLSLKQQNTRSWVTVDKCKGITKRSTHAEYTCS